MSVPQCFLNILCACLDSPAKTKQTHMHTHTHTRFSIKSFGTRELTHTHSHTLTRDLVARTLQADQLASVARETNDNDTNSKKKYIQNTHIHVSDGFCL